MSTTSTSSLPLAGSGQGAAPAPAHRVPLTGTPDPTRAVAALAALLRRYTGEDEIRIGRRAPGVHTTLLMSFPDTAALGTLTEPAVQLGEEVTPQGVVVSDGLPARAAEVPTVVVGEAGLELLMPADIFDEAAVAQYARHLERILAAGPEVSVAEVALLTEAETRRALVEWNDTDAAIPAPFIHELVAEYARTTPQAVAVALPDEQVTYRELDSRANQFAHRLRAAGVRRGDRVGVCFPRGADALIAQLACFKLTAAAILMDPGFPADRLRFMLEDSSAVAVLTSTEHTALVEGADCPVIDLWATDWAAEPTTEVHEPVTADDFIHIGYTSGSTGAPKAVQARFGPARNLIHAMRELCGMTAASQGTWLAAPGYGMIQVECFPVLAAGATVHIPEASVVASPERLQEWILRYGITTTLLMKPMAERLWLLEWPADTRLRDIRVCGERIQAWPPAGLPFRLINLYGSSEATTVSACDITALGQSLGEAGRARALPPIGRPIDNVRTYVLDEWFRPVPPGVVGELCVTGDSLSAGYVNRPELTAQKWISNPIDPERSPVLYRTGDMARYWADGSIEIVGRRDGQIKVRGNTVHLAEIEIVLGAQPGVRRTAVLARADGQGDTQLTAYIEPEAGATPAVRDIRRALRKRLPAFMVPSSFVVGEIPLNTNGKIDRGALPEPPRSRPDVDSPYQAPTTDLERELHELWTAALEVEGLGVLDNFFDLGGDSLRAARVTGQVADRYQLEVEVGDLFHEPTIARMAAYLAAEREARPALATI
ncbi:non-ribosomal peptide synthetase [Micromonospora sp. NPDC047134]|uniref:non-ribosomal peptide synthetase n=1 Tax=Micromonospora sp. NPDC047134 TaxID=3154340 RepID=UPI0033CA252C